MSRQCCEAIETLFDNDTVGEVSLEVRISCVVIPQMFPSLLTLQAVRLIVKMVKAKSYKTKSAVSINVYTKSSC